MSNFLFWSSNNGRTWSEPVQIDDVGGEPGYLVDLQNGNLIFTRTESAPYPDMYDPPSKWGTIYYKNRAVGSSDRGKTWNALGLVADAPYSGDSEVGIVELESGHLLSMTRIGFGGGNSGQPSRIVHSRDGGLSWERPLLSPVYGQRTALHKLKSGKLLFTYRNRWGTPATCAFLFGRLYGIRS